MGVKIEIMSVHGGYVSEGNDFKLGPLSKGVSHNKKNKEG